MPAVPDRRQLGSEEQNEAPVTGPFGGIQSELPPTEIELLGFTNTDNIIFRLGRASLRPGYSSLATLGEPVLGIANFFTVAGDEVQVVMTPTRLLQFASGVFTEITGTGFGGVATDLFSWDVLNYNLCFSQGIDKVWVWDGISASYSLASASAPVGKYMAEIGLHLLVVDPTFPQRYNWSGIGDPTDWTGLTSGLNDNVSNMGPINGLMKVGQSGFGFHQLGILQVIQTGVGLAPFYFQPIINTRQSVSSPYSLRRYVDQGMEFAVYLGVDNVYVFNGSSIEPIGDRPLDGRRRVGARSAILNDVLSAGYSNVYGAITYTLAGNSFRAYWLLIPPNRIWVYNFDEGNWTRFIYGNTIRTIGPFVNQTSLRWVDLIGSWPDQSSTWAGMSSNNPFLGLLLGYDSADPGYVDMSSKSEVAGNLTSGQVTFGDVRHKHNVKRMRVRFVDNGSVTFTLTLTSSNGQNESQSFTLGTGSGQVLSYILSYTLNGLRFIWNLSVPAGSVGDIIEVAPYYDTGGEQRGGTLEN
jgi:hypothetical protein